jgi:hypothetical protein
VGEFEVAAAVQNLPGSKDQGTISYSAEQMSVSRSEPPLVSRRVHEATRSVSAIGGYKMTGGRRFVYFERTH